MAKQSLLDVDCNTVVAEKAEVELLIKPKEAEGQAVRRPPQEPTAGRA
jgi:hypothetical protein